MTVPTYEKFIEPILRFLALHPEGAFARDAHEAAAKALHLSDEDKQQILPSGIQLVYKNRAGWAHDRLKRTGLSVVVRNGFWKITPKGIDFVKANPAPFTTGMIDWLEKVNRDVSIKSLKNAENPTENKEQATIKNTPLSLPTPPAPPLETLYSPDESLTRAVSEIRDSVAGDLKEKLSQVSPTFFETIVLDLLHKMGYGASREDLKSVGGVGDGGIDGIISLDRLGLEKVYVQAKRWQSSVGRPEIQAFYGALAGNRAKKGIFITTSSYTKQAEEYAKSIDGIVLIDGNRLAQLMIDFEVGSTMRQVKVPKLDNDYFDE